MDSNQILCSDNNGCAYGADFLKLARELEIPEDVLKSALDETVQAMRECPPWIRPANKKALRGVATLLAKAIKQLSETGVRERLTVAVCEEPEDPDDWLVWIAAKRRVDQAIEGARDLLEIVKRAEMVIIPPGRPRYDRWHLPIQSLLVCWMDDLQREVTISGHASDPRGVKSSDTVRFVYQSMRLIGEDEITEQACRTILQNLKEGGDNFGLDINEL